MTVKVSKIIIEIGKKTLEFTPEEVGQLQAALNELYPPPKEIVKESYPVYVDRYRNWPWYQPMYSLGIGSGGSLSSDMFRAGSAVNNLKVSASNSIGELKDALKISYKAE